MHLKATVDALLPGEFIKGDPKNSIGNITVLALLNRGCKKSFLGIFFLCKSWSLVHSSKNSRMFISFSRIFLLKLDRKVVVRPGNQGWRKIIVLSGNSSGKNSHPRLGYYLADCPGTFMAVRPVGA